MADVKVGQVRRMAPLGNGAVKRYMASPFEVLEVGELYCMVRNSMGVVVPLTTGLVADAPLWPSEHEQYRDARGYEVKT